MSRPACGGNRLHPCVRLRSALNRLHWSAQTVATMLDVNERTVRRWITGQNSAPENVLKWLDGLAVFIEANPPPTKSV